MPVWRPALQRGGEFKEPQYRADDYASRLVERMAGMREIFVKIAQAIPEPHSGLLRKRLIQDTFVCTRDDPHGDATLREFAPAEGWVEGAEEWMQARAQNRDVAGIWPRLVLRRSVKMDSPQFLLFLGIKREIDLVLDVATQRFAADA